MAACLTAGVAPDQVCRERAKRRCKTDLHNRFLETEKRLTGRYVFTVEQAAQVSGIEAALRRDLADAVMAKMSDQVINGDGSSA